MKYEVEFNVDLKNLNTYGIGGKTKFLVYPRNKSELVELIKKIKLSKTPFYILGGGSNVIFPDEDFNGVMIKLNHFDNFEILGDIVKVESGLVLGRFIKKMLDLGFVNLSNLFGIPGTVGGAVIGNVGANGSTLFDYVVDVTILDTDGEIKVLKKDEIDYGYRYTEFKNSDKIILGATLMVEKGDVNEAWENIKINLEKRKLSQPLEKKNAGSVFKNPTGLSAGKLIEECGLKGLRVNDACVSEKHANFIVNLGSATSGDILELIAKVQSVVKEKKGILLELEQIVVKW